MMFQICKWGISAARGGETFETCYSYVLIVFSTGVLFGALEIDCFEVIIARIPGSSFFLSVFSSVAAEGYRGRSTAISERNEGQLLKVLDNELVDTGLSFSSAMNLSNFSSAILLGLTLSPSSHPFLYTYFAPDGDNCTG